MLAGQRKAMTALTYVPTLFRFVPALRVVFSPAMCAS